MRNLQEFEALVLGVVHALLSAEMLKTYLKELEAILQGGLNLEFGFL